MKRRGFTLIEVLIVVGVLSILAAILTPTCIGSSRHNVKRASCQGQLKQIGLVFRQYTQDWDKKYPTTTKADDLTTSLPPYKKPYYGADAMQLYIKDTDIFHCPSDEDKTPRSQDAVQTGYTDYWMNTNLSGADTAKIRASSTTILLGDGNDGVDLTDARYNRNSLPPAWIDTEDSPARRHLDGANYAFADGHVEWLTPQKVKITRTSVEDYSFAVK